MKGSSLAFLMTVKDVMAVGKIAASFGYNYIEAYLDVFLVYIILCSMCSFCMPGLKRGWEPTGCCKAADYMGRKR